MKPVIFAATASALLFAQSARSGAPAAAPLKPTGSWVINFDDAQCVAEREYGSSGKPLTLVLKQPPIGEVMQVGVVSNGGPKEPEQYRGTIAFDTRIVKASVLTYRPHGSVKGVRLVNMPLKHFAAAAGSKILTFDSGSGVHSTFELEALPSVLQLLNQCAADLRTVWKVDSSEADRQLQGVRGKGLGKLISPNDYPRDAVLAEQSGTVTMALLIDETGKVADCSVIATSGVAILDSQSCAVVKIRAKFVPITDSTGKPIKTSVIQRITWKLG
ncbi:energy transducer TonB [Sphingomonas sinipercae]|uniref:Energy transducer TonB n=1 Tax=Sphingomonas sinipercae TaxID=2714944 RepID=A0A6G7ZPL8_9SPHN|nr:energy transducer TonB [Sphingomonas sinipercae]QIL02883.1 energy transducer TonB [Sphingomonas sinipercae]